MPNTGLAAAEESIQPATSSVRWASPRSSRVCDRCIKQKIKCDLNQPRCSACAASGCPCSYSRTRKKPGPVRGSNRRSERLVSTASPNDSPSRTTDTGLTPAGRTGVAAVDGTPGAVGHLVSTPPPTEETCPPLQSPSTSSPPTSHAAETLKLNSSQLAAETRHQLAESFVSTVNVSFPLFRPHKFQSQLRDGEISEGLASLVYAISAKLTETPQNVDVDAALSSLANASTIETTNILEPAALNEWRTACLLAWYGFYQDPGNKDVRIAILARQAYHFGLHQIDSLHNASSFGWDLVSEDMLEEWRHVWWSIYMLDTHCSYATATPAQIQPDNIGTALLLATQPSGESSMKIFLPADHADLWKVVQEIVAVGGHHISSLHIVVSALLKEVIAVHRRRRQHPRCSAGERISALEDCLCGIQLSLPFNYTRRMRDVASGETPASYHCRLLTALKIHSIRLILDLPDRQLDEARLQSSWQVHLETCNRMFEVVCQWDTQCVLTVDPGIWFIVMALLVLLHLHSKSCRDSASPLLAQLTRRTEVLRLVLQNHATQWALARLLLDSYDAFVRRMSVPLRLEEVCQVIEQFQGPLHQKWLNFALLEPLIDPGTDLSESGLMELAQMPTSNWGQ